ncbi:unnamed protein product [Brachionus calyciflorus]|uniref:Cilia- and flagella-associated protein 300 n=1 Tax=Brachionus calyciflorus TaxID=104777 RepID=A0A813M1Y3_9BILA|nr:unnamed protein product [Brachionus calyciflorus]
MSEKFRFIEKEFDTITGKTNKESLVKWGMRGKLKTFMFTFDKQFHMGSRDSFILDFFQDDNVFSKIKKMTPTGNWINMESKPNKVKVEDVDCTLLSVDIFDKLYEKNIVRENGSIKKCLDDYYEDILIADELRKLLLLEESDNYEIFSDKERNEFLFKLFKHFCLGGQVCQFEDNVQPYIEVARSVYKDLISVQKNPENNKLRIVSYVFRVEVFDEKNAKIYPNKSVIEQDFCYLIVDPYKRHIILLYHRFDGPLFTD